MPAISIKAHLDGNAIQLDEPFDLPRDAQLLVTVLSPTFDTDWANLGAQGLAYAYGDSEPEYSVTDIQP